MTESLTGAFASVAEILDKMKSELKCQICLDLLENAYATPCQHVFCRKCIDQSLNRSDVCPMCKQQVKTRSLREASVTNHVLATFRQLREDAKTLSGTCDAENEMDVCFTQPLGVLPKLPTNNQITHSEELEEAISQPTAAESIPEESSEAGVSDSCAIHQAALDCDLEALKELLKDTRPAALEKTGSEQTGENTPLQLAAASGYADVCELLLAAKAKPDTTEVAGRTALHLSAMNGFADCIQLLIDEGADMLLEDTGGQSAIHFACQNEELESVSVLLECGVDPDLRDGDGDTPLSLAAWGLNGRGSLPICKLLLAKGANPALKNKFGKGSTAGGLVRSRGSKALKDLLLAHLDDVEDRDSDPRAIIRKRQRSPPTRNSPAATPAKKRGSPAAASTATRAAKSSSTDGAAKSTRSGKSVHEAPVHEDASRRSQEKQNLEQQYRFIISSGASGARERNDNWIQSAIAKITSLGGVVAETSDNKSSFDEDYRPTHLLTRNPLKRTEKVIHSCVLGLPILKESFIDESHSTGRFVDELNHRASSDKLWEGATVRWKDLWEQKQQRPLSGKRVFFLSSKDETQPLQQISILERAGAFCTWSEKADSCFANSIVVDFAYISQDVPAALRKRFTERCTKGKVEVVEFSYFVNFVCQRPER